MFTNFTIKKLKGHTEELKCFIKKYHYKKSLPRGCNKIFALYVDDQLYGVASFGYPVGSRVISKYGSGTLELKRFCLKKGNPKNTASWFMGKCMKELKGKADRIISYADPARKHKGTIYKASNFEYLGKQKNKGQAVEFMGVKHHLRTVYQKRNGIPTTTAIELQSALKTGEAKYVSLPRKHIFMYNMKGK